MSGKPDLTMHSIKQENWFLMTNDKANLTASNPPKRKIFNTKKPHPKK